MTARNDSLRGKTALITGAGRGIGAAVALRFARGGASLRLVARTRSELERTARSCEEAGIECTAHVVDVSIHSQVRGLVDSIGRVDILVNAAGILGPVGPLVSNDLDEWEHTVRVNLLGTMFVCREVIPGMISRGAGSIINFSGGGAGTPRPNFSSYAVSKAAVVRLTDTIAAELSGTGVSVNAIAPGLVDTPMLDGVIAAGESAGVDYQHVQAMRQNGDGAARADVAAELALFLASDASKGLTGKLISAVHDAWRGWDATRIESLSTSGWYTLRRLDPFNVGNLEGSA